MAKNKVNGNWVLTRENTTPDSERQIERDDSLFEKLQPLFLGQATYFDLESIAYTKDLNPEDVFIDLHQNYGYICIGTGENPAANEKLTELEKKQRQTAIETSLDEAKIPHILFKGKYMGVEENSYFIPFNDKTLSLGKILQGNIVKAVEKIAEAHKQDSLLISQKGRTCYLYTSGSQKGAVVAGKSAVVYPKKQPLPDDCYSLFINLNNEESVGFSCGLDFNRVYANIEEFAAEDNQTLQNQYRDFTTTMNVTTSTTPVGPKLVVILRGADGYNAYASRLKKELMQVGLNAQLVGTDANIAKINEEISEDSKVDGPKAKWQWPDIRNEFIKRNKQVYDYLLQRNDVDVVVYADMNVLPQYMQPLISTAIDNGHRVISYVANSFIFESNRADFIEQLSNQYGDFMGRHLANFKKPEAQINARKVKIDDIEIDQLHDSKTSDLVQNICSIIRDAKSAVILSTGTADTIFNKSNQQSYSTVKSIVSDNRDKMHRTNTL